MTHLGVIHGDPHLGTTAFGGPGEDGAARLNLLDFGCIRIFPPKFVGGVVGLYRALLRRRPRGADRRLSQTWGFANLTDGAGRRAERLGPFHLRPAAGRPGAHASPTGSRPASTAAARPSRCARR